MTEHRILVVDDNLMSRKVMMQHLSAMGFTRRVLPPVLPRKLYFRDKQAGPKSQVFLSGISRPRLTNNRDNTHA